MTKIEITYVGGQKETFNCESSEYNDNLFTLTIINDAKKREQIFIPLQNIVKITELEYYE